MPAHPSIPFAAPVTEISPARKPLDAAVAAIDIILGVAVVELVGFATFAFGTVKPWSELAVLSTGAGIAGLLAIRVLLAGGLPRTAAYLPIVAFLLLVLLQIVAWPDWVIRILSPRTLADKTALLSDLPGAAQRLRHVTISYYLLATFHDLRVVLLDTAIFLAVLVIARTPRRILALLIGFSLLAAALAALALLQDFLHARNIMWINGADTNTNSGPFVNHSDLSQQMNHLCGWALALLLVLASAAWPRDRWGRGWRIAGIVGLASVFAGGIVATLLSQSRGGIVCAVIAAAIVVLGLALHRGKGSPIWLFVVVGCLALGTALFSGFNSVYARMRSMEQSREYASRIANVKDILGISRQYPLFGSGLGTHGVFFPRFESFAVFGNSSRAEVEYAEALEETGYLGVACVLLFAGIVWVNWKRAAADGEEPIAIAAVGLGFGLAAVMAQSFSDFGQHLPSLGCLSAATCAVLINLGLLGRKPATPRPMRWKLSSALAGRMAFAAAVAAAGVWCVTSALRDWRAVDRAESADALESFMEQDPWFRTETSNHKLLAEIQKAIDLEPLAVDMYWSQGWDRWSALTTPLGSGDPTRAAAAAQLATVDPAHPDLAQVQKIVDAMNEARWICPTRGVLVSFIGDMETDPLHDPIGPYHIRLGATLAPHYATGITLAAQLDARDGLWEDAARLFATYTRIEPDHFYDVIMFYVNDAHRPDLAIGVAPDNYPYLRLLLDNTADPAARKLIATRIEQLLASVCNGPGATADELAALAQIRSSAGDLASAADLYRRALLQNYGQVSWRMARAQILLQQGDRAGAIAEATLCLRLQPDLQQAKDFLEAASNSPR